MKAMTQKEQKVKELCDKVTGLKLSVPQIVIDLVESIEELLNEEEEVRRDSVGAINYDIDLMLEIMNPTLKDTISYLKTLDKAVQEWRDDIEFINITLNLPKES